jgi:hypothetical protein
LVRHDRPAHRVDLRVALVLVGRDLAQVAADGDDTGQRLDLLRVVFVHPRDELRQAVVHGLPPGAVRLVDCTQADDQQSMDIEPNIRPVQRRSSIA